MSEKWILRKEVEFDAAHYLQNYDGKCGNIHGHRWTVSIEIESDKLNEDEMVMDFTEIKKIVMEYDHKLINDIPFWSMNDLRPTAENLAKVIAAKIKDRVVDGKVRVEVEETPGSSIEYVLGG